MTFYHFFNCACLAFAPYFVVYKSSKLSEYSSYPTILFAALAYVATQMVQMIVMATFLPSTEGTHFSLFEEILKTIVNCGTVAGIHVMLNNAKSEKDVRILSVALGWSLAESLMYRLLPLWMGARSLDFTWDYVHIALQANISMVLCGSLVALVWLYNRRATEKKQKQLIIGCVLAHVALPSLLTYLHLSWRISGWSDIAVRALFAAAVAVVTWRQWKLAEAKQP